MYTFKFVYILIIHNIYAILFYAKIVTNITSAKPNAI